MSGTYPNSHNGYRYGRLAEGVVSRLAAGAARGLLQDHGLREPVHEPRNMARSMRACGASRCARSLRRIAQLRDSIQRHVDDLIAAMLDRAGPDGIVDIKIELANQLARPRHRRPDRCPTVRPRRDLGAGEALAAHMSPGSESLARADAAIDAFKDTSERWSSGLHRAGVGPELARIMLEGHSSEALTEDELVAMFVLILFGGSETTTNLLGNGFLALQRHRDAWDQLVADPSGVRHSIEEMIRYDSPHHYLPRVALDDFELGGEQVEAGDTLIIIMGAANRDPDVFSEPARFDIATPQCCRAPVVRLRRVLLPRRSAGPARRRGRLREPRTAVPDARLLTEDIQYGGSAMLRAIQPATELGKPATHDFMHSSDAVALTTATGSRTFAELDDRAARVAAGQGPRDCSPVTGCWPCSQRAGVDRAAASAAHAVALSSSP